MASATRAALAAARAQLSGVAVKDTAVGEGLLNAARLIGSSVQLRSVLADPGTDVQRKVDLLGRVLNGAPAAAVTLVEGAVASRWSAPNDLPLALEELGIRALANVKASDDVAGELLALAEAISSDAELELTLSSSIGDASAKRGIIERLLDGKAAKATIAIAGGLAEQLRGRRYTAVLQRAAEVVADERGADLARVVSATPLSKTQVKALEDALSAEQGRPVNVAVTLDPALIGGVRVHLGDHIIDGSVQARLRELKLQLAS
jgi:F-type H+-transporting ATPase subunit delta